MALPSAGGERSLPAILRVVADSHAGLCCYLAKGRLVADLAKFEAVLYELGVARTSYHMHSLGYPLQDEPITAGELPAITASIGLGTIVVASATGAAPSAEDTSRRLPSCPHQCYPSL